MAVTIFGVITWYEAEMGDRSYLPVKSHVWTTTAH